MPRSLTLKLTAEQRAQLVGARDHHPLPYVRERAAAILKVADGQSGRAVARHGLLRPRWPDTVYDWIHRFMALGLPGLRIRPGRGRKPAFFSSTPQRRAGG
jgi:hypothetical protein